MCVPTCPAESEENMAEKENLFRKALVFATIAHEGQMRKGTQIPYITHPVAVAKIVAELTDDPELRAAALLHDTMEDANVTRETLAENFGERVAALVASESENKREGTSERMTWKLRKRETLDHLLHADRDTKLVCLGDKLANLRDIDRDREAIGDNLWERFNAPEDGAGAAGKMANIGWYYRGVAERLKSEFGETDAWQELDGLVTKVFGI